MTRTDSSGILPALCMGFGMVGLGPMAGGLWGGQVWSDGTVPGWMVLSGVPTPLLFLAATVG